MLAPLSNYWGGGGAGPPAPPPLPTPMKQFKIFSENTLSSSNWRGDGQTDWVPGVRNYGYLPLNLMWNTVRRIGQKKNIHLQRKIVQRKMTVISSTFLHELCLFINGSIYGNFVYCIPY